MWTNWGAAAHRAAVNRLHTNIENGAPGLQGPLTSWWTTLQVWESGLAPSALAAARATPTGYAAHVANWLRSDAAAGQFAGDVSFANAGTGAALNTSSVVGDTHGTLPPFVLAAFQITAPVATPADSPSHVRLMMTLRGLALNLYESQTPQSSDGPQAASAAFAYDFLWCVAWCACKPPAFHNSHTLSPSTQA